MELLNNLQIIIGLIATLSTGGIIGSIIGLRYHKRKELAQVHQDESAAVATELSNAREVINLYRETLDDLTKLNEQKETAYLGKIKSLEDKLNECTNELAKYRGVLKEYEKKVDDLTKIQLKLKLEMMNWRDQSESKCSECDFRDGCMKYKTNININRE